MDIIWQEFPKVEGHLMINTINTKYQILFLPTKNILSLRQSGSLVTYSDISGFSGGGIIKFNEDYLTICGIQSRTPEEGIAMGKFQLFQLRVLLK